mmetsp:Transcript_36585/g.91734  ORF Transcript_36585/g.91734 Transcript_36585/m.91734 type:complete len:296 (+) Transcript_36585:235-1122(+)
MCRQGALPLLHVVRQQAAAADAGGPAVPAVARVEPEVGDGGWADEGPPVRSEWPEAHFCLRVCEIEPRENLPAELHHVLQCLRRGLLAVARKLAKGHNAKRRLVDGVEVEAVARHSQGGVDQSFWLVPQRDRHGVPAQGNHRQRNAHMREDGGRVAAHAAYKHVAIHAALVCENALHHLPPLAIIVRIQGCDCCACQEHHTQRGLTHALEGRHEGGTVRPAIRHNHRSVEHSTVSHVLERRDVQHRILSGQPHHVVGCWCVSRKLVHERARHLLAGGQQHDTRVGRERRSEVVLL